MEARLLIAILAGIKCAYATDCSAQPTTSRGSTWVGTNANQVISIKESTEAGGRTAVYSGHVRIGTAVCDLRGCAFAYSGNVFTADYAWNGTNAKLRIQYVEGDDKRVLGRIGTNEVTLHAR
jgi:hypothetical protein